MELVRRDDDRERVTQRALAELRSGRKRSHWMWYIFPQLAGLGRSATSRHYAIGNADEAKAYLAHPLLGPRLIECATAVVEIENRSAYEIFGSPDDLKLHIKEHLAGYKVPREVTLLDELPRNATGKVVKRELLDPTA